MTIYVDPKLIGRRNFRKLENHFSQVNFVTDVNHPKDIEALITMPQIVKEMVISDYPKLKWIQFLMAGYDGIDLDSFRRRNIDFCNAQDIFSKSIAEDVFAKIFYFNRNIKYYIESKNEKIWEPIREEPEIAKSTVLILGVGSIGKELAKRFKAFEAYIIGYRSRDIMEDNFDEIITSEEDLNMAIQRADYVILALPLTDMTTYMFNKDKLSMMKSTALLINVARGKVIKQSDLVKSLINKDIRGAGLDVFDPEPLAESSPLWDLENVYITPHNASSSPYMRDRLFDMIVMNLSLYLSGKPVKYILN
jgi:phosphoglycerate dehydrogenase-like enzyme